MQWAGLPLYVLASYNVCGSLAARSRQSQLVAVSFQLAPERKHMPQNDSTVGKLKLISPAHAADSIVQA